MNSFDHVSDLSTEETEEFDRGARGVIEAAKAFPMPTGLAIDPENYALALIATGYLRACQEAGWPVERVLATLAACIINPSPLPPKGRLS